MDHMQNNRWCITKLSKKINGGTNGLADRIDKTNEYYQLIK
jgi:predicted chitinase